MKTASDLAEWWQRHREESETLLTEFVQEHPDWWVLGALGASVMDVGGVYVDLLRFGEGFGQGDAKGVVQDLFRGLSIVSGVTGPGARMLGRAATRISFYTDPGGPTCAIIASTNALRRSGQKVLVSLDDLARAHGTNLEAMLQPGATGVGMRQTMGALQKLGVRYQELGNAQSLEHIFSQAAASRGVVMFRVSSPRGGHRLFAEKVGSSVKIFDRTGVYDDLVSISRRYNTVFSVEPSAPLIRIPEALARLLPHGVATLMLSVTPYLGINPKVNPEQLDQELERFKAQRQTPAAPPPAGSKKITVARGDTLSGLAKAEYGSFELWPLLWDANRDTVGPNPNRLQVGASLWIPPLSSFKPDHIQDARRRAPTWKNYPL